MSAFTRNQIGGTWTLDFAASRTVGAYSPPLHSPQSVVFYYGRRVTNSVPAQVKLAKVQPRGQDRVLPTERLLRYPPWPCCAMHF